MTNRTPDVDAFLSELSHPLKDGIADLRSAILASDAAIRERIKWNAPSFGYGDDDRVTFLLRPADRLQLVFHRGAKVRDDADDFAFEDGTGLLEWKSRDRAILALSDASEVQEQMPAVVALVGRWIRATA